MMNAAEFKAWFEGYTEFITGTPTRGQWERIKTCVGKLTFNDVEPVIHRQILDALRKVEATQEAVRESGKISGVLAVRTKDGMVPVSEFPSKQPWHTQEWKQGPGACPVGTPKPIFTETWPEWPDGSPRLITDVSTT